MSRAVVTVVGCGVLGPDLRHVAQALGLELRATFLPGGLHNRPEELRRKLQEAVEAAAGDPACRRVVVGYGLCGRGTVDLEAPRVPLVIPRVHDCIALFLGSDQAYQREFQRCPGTFYISAGWYAEKVQPRSSGSEPIWIGNEAVDSRVLKERYGERDGEMIIDFFSSWQKNYQRAAFIDTGIGHATRYEEHARRLAEKYSWRFERLSGDPSLLEALLTAGASTEELLVVPPGYRTVYSPMGGGLTAVPRSEAASVSWGEQRRFLEDADLEEPASLKIRFGLGIDAGGTYTDAAIYDFRTGGTRSKNKALTTKWNFAVGIDQALSGLAPEDLSRVELVSVSTTLATNAIVEGEGQKVGLLLMSAGDAVGRDRINHTPRVYVRGRLNIRGEQLEAVDPEEIRRVAHRLVEREGVGAFAVSGFGGSVNPAHELTVKKILQEETGKVVTCGHELSDLLNFLTRARTATLNAQIIPRMIKFFRELEEVLESRGIRAPVMVVKGDGSLMSAAMAGERPVETVLSGPAASVAGARHLTGLTDAMVVDMGGTTTDTATLSSGRVTVCEAGARVGGHATHVKALDMRTEGLGGDSLIRWLENSFAVGPRRVAPVVWADAYVEGGIDRALTTMEERLRSRRAASLEQVILVALEGNIPFDPTERERELYRVLRRGPHTAEEAAAALEIPSFQFLPLSRLEECGLVQRCGLTPTDLLHVAGRLHQWDPIAGERMTDIVAALAGLDRQVLVERLLEQVSRNLAVELLRKQLSGEVATEGIEKCPVCRHLIENLLSGGNDRYTVGVTFHQPVIGIGAPIHYFLPRAGEILNAEVVIPEDADVANALGAVTSRVRIRRQATIRPDSSGSFTVEGFAGNLHFRRLLEAETWVVHHLKESVQHVGREAGTSRRAVEVEISDDVADAADGTSLFLGRTVTATLSGRPDLALVSGAGGEG